MCIRDSSSPGWRGRAWWLLPLLVASATVAAKTPWQPRMAKMSGALSGILLDVAAYRAPPEEAGWQRMLANARILTEFSHQARRDQDKPFADPSLAIMAAGVAEDAKELEWALKTRNLSYARGMVFAVANGCVGCHARNASGPQFPMATQVPGEEKLAPLERAALHAATRRFDQAMDGYLKIIADPEGPTRQALDWDRAISAALSVAIRVKKDPALAQQIATSVANHPGAPQFIRRDAAAWTQAIQAWHAEPASVASEALLHQRAQMLLTQAAASGGIHNKGSAAVQLLRAAAASHDQLDLAPNGPLAAEALWMLGVAYGQLEGLELWTIDLHYFAACIRKQPHSPVAARCFENYESSTWREYAGTGPLELPPDVSARLAQLRALAL